MARSYVRSHYRVDKSRRGGREPLWSRLLPWALGATALGVLLWPGTASAGQAAPGGTQATILSNLQPRTGPSPTAPELYPGDPNPNAPAGMTVTVLQTGIASTSPLSREWWKVRFPDGREGFVSAVGPNGEVNLRRL